MKIRYQLFTKVIDFIFCTNHDLNYLKNLTKFIASGDLINEEQVLKWLIEQKTTATIEEVTDEILKTLIDDHEYVLVYFSKPVKITYGC